MHWRVTLTQRYNSEIVYYYFESQLEAVGFLVKSIFIGNYSKHEIEFILKA